MRKTVCKHLRKIAASLPDSIHEGTELVYIEGKDLNELQRKILTAQGKTINDTSTYTFLKKKVLPVNHYRKLKKYYKKYGMDFYTRYLADFKLGHSVMFKKYPKAFTPNGSN